jgi:predicted ester cyclase
VAVRVTASARQVGEIPGVPSTGGSYTIGEIHIFRFRDGKVTEHWHQYDQLARMKQLGAT